MGYTIEERKKRIEILKDKIWANAPIPIEKLCNIISLELGISVETIKKYLNVLIGNKIIIVKDGVIYKNEK